MIRAAPTSAACSASASALVEATNNRVGFRIDLEDYLYNGDFGGGDDFQNDLVASVGVSFALGGSAERLGLHTNEPIAHKKGVSPNCR